MKFASKFTYINQKKNEPEVQKEKMLRKNNNILINEDELFKTDVNVMSIGFAFLKEAQKNIGTGDAMFCSNCKAVLNSFSKLMNKDEYLMKVKSGDSQPQKIEIEEEKKSEIDKIEPVGKFQQEFEDVKPNEVIWICEFCEKQNKLMLEEEEIPKKNDMIYIIESKNQEKKTDQDSDISIILCVDNSGSMSITTEVKGKMNLKHGLTEDEYKMLKDFLEPGAEKFQYLPSQKKNVSWVSRKQCVLAAIETQLNEMKVSHPNRKVGLITFNNDVAIIGDGNGEPKFIAGDKLFKYKEIFDTVITNSDSLLKEPLKNSSQTLISQFNRLEEGGKTSLGPALLASVALASKGKKGSMVVICTDGLANVGLGSLDLESEQEESRKFYDQVSKFAQEQNIIISVITIKGEGCKIETLGKLCDDTNGNVTRVNPDEISQDFSGILKDEIVATNVDLEIRLHKGLKFCNEDQVNLSEDGSLLKRKIGNATINTEVAFQYEIKGEDELKQMNIDIEKALEVPFQAQIHYVTPDGHKCMRTITHIQKLTKNKDLAEKNADVKILHFAAAQKSSKWAQMGEYEVSRKYNKNWANYLESNTNMNMDEDNFRNNVEMQKKQKVLRGAIVKKEKKSEKMLGLLEDSDEEIKMKNLIRKEDEEGLNKKAKPKSSPPSKKVVEKKPNMESKKKMALSKVVEKPEKNESFKAKKKTKERELSCSSGSEKMVDSDDEGEAVIFKMKKGMK